MIGQMAKRAGLGNEPGKIFNEIAQIKAVDIMMPTRRTPLSGRDASPNPPRTKPPYHRSSGYIFPRD
jgi:hypothetical protein